MPDSNDTDSKQAQADDELIVRYFDGQLDAAGVAALNDRLKVEPALRHRLIDLTLQTHYVSALVGKPDLALVQDELLNHQPGRASLKLSVPTSYRIGFAGVCAAVLALAVTLVVVLTGGESADPTTDLAQTPDTIVTPDEPATRTHTVATLTATHNATWAERASAPGSALTTGSKLHPNQRLTLTAGSAEITTNDGAIAVLQAPATIELLNNDNALRLHSGKLVGICETESSKDFLVRTPHMDITDLGTRFGVDVVRGLATEVHVHQGEVVVAPTNAPASTSTQKQIIIANQAVRSVDAGRAIAAIAPDFEQFGHALSTHRFRGTGFGLAEGAVDPNWQLTADANGPLASPMPVTVQHSVDKHYKAVGNDPDRAQWLFFGTHFNDFYYPFHAPEDLGRSRLTFSSQLELPEHVELEDSALFLRFATTEGIHELRINGTAVAGLPMRATKGGEVIFHEIEVPIDQTALTVGTNKIDVVLKNQTTEDHANFYIAWEIRPATSTTQAASAP